MEREDALHADAGRDLAHGKGGPGTAATATDNRALEDLDALFVAFLNLHVDPDGIARAEFRPLPEKALFDLGNLFHRIISFLTVSTSFLSLSGCG